MPFLRLLILLLHFKQKLLIGLVSNDVKQKFRTSLEHYMEFMVIFNVDSTFQFLLF